MTFSTSCWICVCVVKVVLLVDHPVKQLLKNVCGVRQILGCQFPALIPVAAVVQRPSYPEGLHGRSVGAHGDEPPVREELTAQSGKPTVG